MGKLDRIIDRIYYPIYAAVIVVNLVFFVVDHQTSDLIVAAAYGLIWYWQRRAEKFEQRLKALGEDVR